MSPLVLLLGLAAAAPTPVVADRLVELHVAWLGGAAALADARTLSWSGRMEAGGMGGELAVRATRTGERKQTRDLGVVSDVIVVGAAGAWKRTFNGQVEPMGAADTRRERRNTAVAFWRHLLADVGAVRSDRGSQRREGRRWRVLRWAWPDGDYLELFLDPTNGQCTWMRDREDGELSWWRLEDWRMVSGIRVPFSVRYLHDDPGRDVSVRWTAVKVNEPLAAAEFAKPAPRPIRLRFPGGAGATPWLAAELVEGRYVYLEGAVAGRKLPVLLDSGAEMSVISSALVDELKLARAGRIRLEGVAAAQGAGFVSGIDLAVGPLGLEGLTMLATDLSGVERAMSRPTPVVLGKELFNALVVDLDYPGSRVAFHDPAGHRPPGPPAEARLVPVLPGKTRAVAISVEGLPPAPVALDTGAGNALTLFAGFTRKHGLLAGRSPRSQRLIRGIGGGTTAAVATLKKVTIGGLDLPDVPAEFHEGREGAFATGDIAGNLGAGLLEQFRVVFDFSRERLYLVTGAGWKPRPFRKNRVGLQADLRGDQLEVVFVAPGSPAARGGWRAGQRIRAIDGHAIRPDYAATQQQWLYGPAGAKVVLTDSKGAHRSLTLAEYY
jgi:hypothetical protein